MRSLWGFLAAVASLASQGVLAESNRPRAEYLCSAQCIRIGNSGHIEDFGYPATGWSEYSLREAYQDLLNNCPSPRILARGIERKRWRFEPRLYFSSPERACVRSLVTPDGGKRYGGGHPIGG